MMRSYPGSTAPLRRRFLTFVAILATAGSLVACTGDDPKTEPSTGGGASASAGAGTGTSELAKAAEQVTQQYLTAPEATVLASTRGTVQDGGGKNVAGTLELLAVQAGPGSAAVRWRLKSDQPIDTVSTNYYNNIQIRLPDTDAVELVAKQANLRALPGIWSIPGLSTNDCTCAYVPHGLGPAGVELSSLYPVLPESVTEIELRVPGFPALSAPVTRN